jgi:uncharacterized protein (DUF1015 family)
VPARPGWHHEPVVDLQPFTALRPLPHLAHRVAAPPYDVVDAEQAAAMIHASPDSFLRVTRPDADPWLDDSRPNGRSERNRAGDAERGLAALRELVRRGVLVREEAPAYWVYRQQVARGAGAGHVQTGVVGLASVADYEAGVIKVHEHTRPDKEDERAHHVDVLDAHDEPVFLFHPGSAPLEAAVAEVTAAEHDLAVTTPDGVWHTLWRVPDGAPQARIHDAFAALGALYVADGHHRSAAAVRLHEARLASPPGEAGETGGFLAVVFPAAELTVLPYQRLVTDLGGLTPQALLARLEPEFDVEPSTVPVLPDDRTTIGLRTEAGWHRLRLRAQAPPAGGVQGLAVSLLQDRVLAPLLGITDPRRDPRLAFAGGPAALADLDDAVSAGRARAGFTLAPTSVGELVAVSDRGEVMPPKSTWFHPKPASGLLVHPLH